MGEFKDRQEADSQGTIKEAVDAGVLYELELTRGLDPHSDYAIALQASRDRAYDALLTDEERATVETEVETTLLLESGSVGQVEKRNREVAEQMERLERVAEENDLQDKEE
ncbi:hypothetical protein KW792_00105 [Candidatus Saccharibacteria bacterium]|nr:hypothetical protein [Candidatus Saccharibacteria bacterium]